MLPRFIRERVQVSVMAHAPGEIQRLSLWKNINYIHEGGLFLLFDVLITHPPVLFECQQKISQLLAKICCKLSVTSERLIEQYKRSIWSSKFIVQTIFYYLYAPFDWNESEKCSFKKKFQQNQ